MHTAMAIEEQGGASVPGTSAPEASEPSDNALMAQVQAGDAAAAQLLVQRHLHWVIALAHQRLRNHAEAEEVAQDAFAAVWHKAQQWDDSRAKFTTWLYSIVANRCTDILRRRRPAVALEDAHDVADTGAKPFDQLADTQRRKILVDALDSLPLEQREALELVYFGELGQAQAAQILNISLAALESRLRRARQALQKILFDRKADLLDESTGELQ